MRLIGPKLAAPSIRAGGAVEEPAPWIVGLGPQRHQVVQGIRTDAGEVAGNAAGLGVVGQRGINLDGLRQSALSDESGTGNHAERHDDFLHVHVNNSCIEGNFHRTSTGVAFMGKHPIQARLQNHDNQATSSEDSNTI
jgi:hypothetical protein